MAFNSLLVVRSPNSKERHWWKITDFCSSDHSLVAATQPQYKPPEITVPDGQDLSQCRESFASWSLGCLIYELNAGQPAFPTLHSLVKYRHDGEPLQIQCDMNPWISAARRQLDKTEESHVREMWASVYSLDFGGIEVSSHESQSSESRFACGRLLRINHMVAAALKGVTTRPSVKDIEKFAAVNVIRSKLEDDKVGLPELSSAER